MKARGTTQGLNFEVRCQSKARKFKFVARVQSSVKLEKWSFHVADLPRTGKKCAGEKKKKTREERAKLLFLFFKYAKFVALPLPSRRRS